MSSRRVLILYLSFAGAGARVAREAARALEAHGEEVELALIEPSYCLPYPLWLLLSFIPGVATPIAPLTVNPEEFDRCVLIFPKWTFNCPPLEGFIKRYADKLPPAILLTVCGGWDEERYLEGYRKRFAGAGARIIGALSVKRCQVGKAHLSALLGIELDRL